MTTARALVQADGFCTWQTGILDPGTGLFAYQAWKRNVAYAKVIGPDGYINLEIVA